MSWFFGVQKTHFNNFPLHHFHSEAIFSISTPKLYLAFGGIPETCIITKESEDSGWAVVGLGIKVGDRKVEFIGKEEWCNILSKEMVDVDKLDGHFILLRWKNDEVEMFSDQLGLRTAYYAQYSQGICFSTRLDWVAKTTNKNEINLESIADRWLLFNQLSFKSCVNGIERLGPSGHVAFSNEIISKNKYKEWTFEKQPVTSSQAISLLEHLTCLPIEKGRGLSLSLSGGFDSRTILSLLLRNNRNFFTTYTFGEKNDPDALIANQIALDLGLKHSHYDEPLPDDDSLIKMIQEYAAQNILVAPVSEVLRLRCYKYQYLKKAVIVDGGFGEIGRRQYLNRLKILGGNAIQCNDIDRIFRHLQVFRADIFEPEYLHILENYAKESLERKLAAMPPVREIGIDNFLDLFSLRTRIPNFGGIEQARSDSEVVSYMPMVQPSFLKHVFSLDIKHRKNGKLYREIIQSYAPQLTLYPLVKGGTTYPFRFSSVPSWIFIKLKNKFSKPFIGCTSKEMLFQLRSYVYDLAQGVKDYPLYSQVKIKKAIDVFYKGDETKKQTVEWWLTFDLWRKSFNNK